MFYIQVYVIYIRITDPIGFYFLLMWIEYRWSSKGHSVDLVSNEWTKINHCIIIPMTQQKNTKSINSYHVPISKFIQIDPYSYWTISLLLLILLFTIFASMPKDKKLKKLLHWPEYFLSYICIINKVQLTLH